MQERPHPFSPPRHDRTGVGGGRRWTEGGFSPNDPGAVGTARLDRNLDKYVRLLPPRLSLKRRVVVRDERRAAERQVRWKWLRTLVPLCPISHRNPLPPSKPQVE
jgi:hypothetical protein